MIVKYFLRQNNARPGTVTKDTQEYADISKVNKDATEKKNASIFILQEQKKRALRAMIKKICKNKELKDLSVNNIASLQQGLL